MQHDATTFRVRLRVRLAKSLTSKEKAIFVKINERYVKISSQSTEKTLEGEKWIILSSGGFATKDDASNFANLLKNAVSLAGAFTYIGIDIGEDAATSHMDEAFARLISLIGPDDRLHPNIHGVIHVPDDGKSRFPMLNATANVSSDAQTFIDTLSFFAQPAPSIQLRSAIRIFNAALMSLEPLAQMALAISIVEALGQGEAWSPHQLALLEKLAEQAEGGCGAGIEEQEVAEAIRRGMFRIGLRQGVLRVFKRLGLNLKKSWDDIYGKRSGIIHGTKPLPPAEVADLAVQATRLCGQVIAALLEAEGIRLPASARLHFPTPE